MKAFYLTLLAVALLSSCASGPERRISKNAETFSKLSTADQASVRAGKIREGMSKEAVFMAWGRPSSVADGKRSGVALERWSYTEMQPVMMTGFGGGFGGWGGWGGCGRWGGAPFMMNSVNYIPTAGPTVEFTNGRVTGYTVPR
jgi:hypothetical protein